MSVLSPRNVYAPGREPPKAEIVQLLEQLFNVASGPSVVRLTKASLDLVTPAAETYGGVVLNDPDPANDGYYYRSSAVWVKGRGFPDTLAELTVVGGTANAVQAATGSGVNPGDIVAFYIDVATPNTGPVRVAVNGAAAIPAYNVNGSYFAPGEWSGRIFLSNEGAFLQALVDPAAAASAAASAAAAAQSAADAQAGLGRPFDTLAAAQAYAPSSAPNFVQIAGYSAPGDGGGAIYKKVAAEPSHAGKFSITLDDAATVVWYEIAETAVYPEMFGAAGSGSGDDTAALAHFIAFAQAKSLGGVFLRPGAVYLADELDVPDDMLVMGGRAQVKRRVNRAFPLVNVGKRSTVDHVIANGNMTALGSASGGTRMTGIALDDDATAVDCESFDNARHGISNKNVADQLQYYRVKVIRCYVHGNGADPTPDGFGKGDGINMTNVTDFIVRDCVSRNSGRSDMVVTTYDTATDTTNPALSLGGIIDNIDVDGAAYIGAEVNFEKCSNVKLTNSRLLTAGIVFNSTDDVLIQNVQCRSINSTAGNRPRLFNVDIVHPTRSAALLTLTGEDPWVDHLRVQSTMTGTPTGNTVEILPTNFKGKVHNVTIGKSNNALVMYVDNFSNISVTVAPLNRFLREGPTGASYDYLTTDNPRRANGLTEAYLAAPPTSGTWARGDRVWDKTPDASLTPGWVCTVAGAPGTWKAMAALAS